MSDLEDPGPASDLPEDKVFALLHRMGERFEKLGLELKGAVTSIDATSDEELAEYGEVREHRLITMFRVLPTAFSNRVINPEREQTDDTIRVMERDAVTAEADRIRNEIMENYKRSQAS